MFVALTTYLVTVFCQTSLARDYYVNNVTGDDRSTGEVDRSLAGQGLGRPFRTIGKALKVATTGDRIFVEKTDVPYRECLSIQGAAHSGTRLKKFHIISNGAILDGTREVGDRWEFLQDNIYRFKPERKSFQQLFNSGKPIPQTRLQTFDSPLELEPEQWTLQDGWIYFRTDGKIPQQYQLSYCFHPVGITLYQVHDVAIEGLVVQGFHLDGINAHDGVTESILLSNVLRGNGRSGLSVGGASQVDVVACLLGDNGAAQLRTEGQSKTTLENCDLIDAEEFGPPVSQTGGKIARIGE